MKKLYWAAIGFSALAVMSVGWIAYEVAVIFAPPRFALLQPAPPNDKFLIATLAVSAAFVLVSTIGTAVAILLGWRNDRRHIEQLTMKLQQVEAQRAAGA